MVPYFFIHSTNELLSIHIFSCTAIITPGILIFYVVFHLNTIYECNFFPSAVIHNITINCHFSFPPPSTLIFFSSFGYCHVGRTLKCTGVWLALLIWDKQKLYSFLKFIICFQNTVFYSSYWSGNCCDMYTPS